MKSLSLPQPHAIIMVGIPGSGKTFFAQKFADTFNSPYVSLENVLPHSASSEAAALLVEHQLRELTKTKLSIVAELNTDTRARRTELAQLVKNAGYVPLFVWVQTDPETARIRISRSKQKSSDDFDGQVKRFSPPHASEKPVVISGKHTYASQAKIILKHLSAPRAEISSHKQPPVRQNGQSIVVR